MPKLNSNVVRLNTVSRSSSARSIASDATVKIKNPRISDDEQIDKLGQFLASNASLKAVNNSQDDYIQLKVSEVKISDLAQSNETVITLPPKGNNYFENKKIANLKKNQKVGTIGDLPKKSIIFLQDRQTGEAVIILKNNYIKK